MTNKEKREALLIDGTCFLVAGINDTFKINRYTEDKDVPGSGLSVRKNEVWAFAGMNVSKITANAIYLYDFTVFGKRVKEIIKLKDITIVK